jgi:hypothetical protein
VAAGALADAEALADADAGALADAVGRWNLNADELTFVGPE